MIRLKLDFSFILTVKNEAVVLLHLMHLLIF